MKGALILSFLLFALSSGYSQSTREPKGAILTWEKSTHDFGDVQEGEKVEHTFRFTNTGNQSLIITNVEVTCGCTTPKGWPRDPIAAGESGEITVAFNSKGKYGKQNKVVIITSNSIGNTNQVIFSANVVKKKEY